MRRDRSRQSCIQLIEIRSERRITSSPVRGTRLFEEFFMDRFLYDYWTRNTHLTHRFETLFHGLKVIPELRKEILSLFSNLLVLPHLQYVLAYVAVEKAIR
jgi:hypothetical protein